MAYWGNGRRATYLYSNCMKSKHTDWRINISFIIHEDFDRAQADHYPVTLITCIYTCNRVVVLPEKSGIGVMKVSSIPLLLAVHANKDRL